MRLDEVTAEIRPRGDWEAVDLGFAMVRRDFWRCVVLWWMAMALPTIIAGIVLWDHPFWLLVVLWWLKPAGSRMVLYEISRRLFGEQPGWRVLWREVPRAWTRRFFQRFVVGRLSPWLPLTMAVEDLEGLRGQANRQRKRQIAQRGESAIMWIYLVSQLAALWFGAAILVLLLVFIPEGQDGAWRLAMEAWDPMILSEMPLLVGRVTVGCIMAAMTLADLFATGAGFGLYINNRTWLEGWDVELAFRRLALRLGKVAVLVACWIIPAGIALGQEIATPADRMEQVLADKDFIVHTVTDHIPKEKAAMDFGLPTELIQVVAMLLAISAVAALVVFILRGVWRNRHAFRFTRRGGMAAKSTASARVVMGMAVSPDSIPEDVPTVAWKLWQSGKHHEALGLLYRGSISRVMEIARVEIQESDTESDCLRRVDAAGETAHPGYFHGLTGVWMRLAYAGMTPADAEVEVLCKQWPFGKGGPR